MKLRASQRSPDKPAEMSAKILLLLHISWKRISAKTHSSLFQLQLISTAQNRKQGFMSRPWRLLTSANSCSSDLIGRRQTPVWAALIGPSCPVSPQGLVSNQIRAGRWLCDVSARRWVGLVGGLCGVRVSAFVSPVRSASAALR